MTETTARKVEDPALAPTLTFSGAATRDERDVLKAGQCYLDSEGDLVVVLTDAEPGGCVVIMADGREPFFLETPSAGEPTPEQWERVTDPVTLHPNTH